MSVDLNADLGEGEPGGAGDVAMLEIVTTASIAGGGHAGGGVVLSETVRLAAERGVRVGAHPSYPDRERFGRTSMADLMTPAAIAATIADQVVVVADECAAAGIGLSHVKAHGALYNDAAVSEAIARAVLAGVGAAARRIGRDGIPILGMPSSVLQDVVDAEGGAFITEAFADRAYASDGRLVPRGVHGSVIVDTLEVCRQALEIALTASVMTVDGVRIPIAAQSICLHGDTPGAVEHARAVRAALESSGVVVAPWESA